MTSDKSRKEILSDIYVEDNVTATNKITSAQMETENLTADSAALKELAVSKRADQTGGTADIAGDATVGGTLGVTGDTTLSADLSVAGDETVTGTLGVTGDTTLDSNLSVAGDETVTGNATVGGTLSVTGAATLNSTLDVAGDTALSADLSIAGNESVTGTLDVTGDTALGNVTAGGDASVGGTLGVTGKGTLGSLEVTGTTALDSTLDVAGAATLSSTLDVMGDTTLNGDLDVVMDAEIRGALDVTGAAALSSDLSVSGNSTLSGTLNVGGAATLSNDVSVSGDLTVNGTTTSTGRIIGNDGLSIADDNSAHLHFDDTDGLQTDKDITLVGTDSTVTTDIIEVDTIQSRTSADSVRVDDDLVVTGALEVTGGTSVGADLSVTGAETVGSTLAVTNKITGNNGLEINDRDALDNSIQLSYNENGLTVSGGETVDTLAVSGNATIGGTLGVTGNTTLSSTLGVTGNTSLSTVSTSGLATLNSLSVSGNTQLGGNLTTPSGKDITLNNQTAHNILYVDGNKRVQSTIGVANQVLTTKTENNVTETYWQTPSADLTTANGTAIASTGGLNALNVAKAPNVHADQDPTKYGVGTLENYGHVRFVPAVDTGRNVSVSQTLTVSEKGIIDFVNDSVNNVAAYYITNSAGEPWATKAALMAATVDDLYSGGAKRTPTRNDYTIVSQDETKKEYTLYDGYANFTTTTEYVGHYIPSGNSYTLVTASNKDSLSIVPGTTEAYEMIVPSTRYIYTGADGTPYDNTKWSFQYTFNMQFTTAQMQAINSGINAARVAKLDDVEPFALVPPVSSDWSATPSNSNVASELLTKTKIDLVQTNLNTHAARTDNPHTVTKAQVGLGSVINQGMDDVPTASSVKYVKSGGIYSAIKTVQDDVDAHEARTDNPHSVTKTQVGLGSVVNQGMDNVPTENSDKYAKSGGIYSAIKTVQDDIDAHEARTDNPHSVTKAQVSLGSVVNQGMDDSPTQNSAKYVKSGGVYTAIKTVQDDVDAHEAKTDNPHSVTKAQVGLGNCDNTSDLNKPVSTATQTELDKKLPWVTHESGLYAYTNSTTQGQTQITKNATANAIAQRGTDGTLQVATPTDNTHATTKAYVDGVDATKITGPSSAVNKNIVIFNGTTGKSAMDSGLAVNTSTNTITGNITGNAGTATNVAYTGITSNPIVFTETLTTINEVD